MGEATLSRNTLNCKLDTELMESAEFYCGFHEFRILFSAQYTKSAIHYFINAFVPIAVIGYAGSQLSMLVTFLNVLIHIFIFKF